MGLRMRIFLSCVSKELGSYRLKLADHLRSRLTASDKRAAESLEIRSQEDFEQGDYTLLERLADYIGQCDQEIHLVGDLCGSRPTAEHVRMMFARLGQPSPDPIPDLSYTQWEYRLARILNKPVKCYVTSHDARRDCDPTTQSEEEAVLQREYVAALKASGKHRSEFAGHVDLLKQVLHDMGLDDHRKVNNLPYGSLGKQFKGREEFLQQLRTALGEAEHEGHQQVIAITAPATVATVHGLGGVGKTRAALEYAHRFADEYTALLFVEADTPEKFEVNLANLCGVGVINLAEQEARETKVKVSAVREWLKHHPGWFLILDNVDSPEAAKTIHRFLGSLGQSGQTVITSRLASWPTGMEALALDLLRVEDAAEFLLDRTEPRRPVSPDDEMQARDLAVELGQLALALEQAGALIFERAYSFAEYRQEWHKNNLAVLGWFDESVMLYPRSVATTWQTSFNQIGEQAQRLLRMVCWLAADPIPVSILNDEVLLFCLGGSGGKEVNTRAALGDLARFSLSTFQNNSQTFVVHRLVQEITRTTIPEDVKDGYLKSSLGWIDNVFQGNPEDSLLWPVLNLLAPHAESVAELADAQGIPWQTARLFSDLGALYYSERQNVKAEALMNRALEIDEKFCGPDSARVATRLGNLALLLIENSRLEEAEGLIRRALKIDETIKGPEHPVVAIRLLTLARLLKKTDRAAEAEQIMRRALAIDYIASGPWHGDVARDLDALGLFLLGIGRTAEADPLFRRALEIDERTLGPMHPFLALHLNNLGTLLIAVNQLAEAEPLLRRSLGIFMHVAGILGKDPPHLKNASENYIHLLLLMGNTKDQIQIKLYELALDFSAQ